MKPTVLIVDDKPENLKLLKSILESRGFTVHQAPNAQFAASLLRKNIGRYALAIVDFHMPGMNGDEATRLFHQIDRDLQVITISGDDSDDTADLSIKAGSYIFLPRGVSATRLVSIVEGYCARFEKRQRCLSKSVPLNEAAKFIDSFRMVGASKSTVQVCDLVDRFAKRDLQVLIRGENGTGKEHVAKLIHERSAVKHGPFVAVNCGAINAGIIDSELFGHVKGSFTGAIQNKLGYFREADKGTIFLDEIGDLQHNLQVKLLRAIQEQEITPVGSSTPIKINVRVVAATNVDLEKAIKQGNFREDLFYRLDVLTIKIEPLRKRTEDIEPLVRHFINQWEVGTGECREFHSDVIEALKSYSWPGNVRELESFVCRALASTADKVIEYRHLADKFKVLTSEPDTSNLVGKLNRVRAEYQYHEREILAELVRENGLSRSAKLLQMAKSTLYDRMKSLGLQIKSLTEEKL